MQSNGRVRANIETPISIPNVAGPAPNSARIKAHVEQLLPVEVPDRAISCSGIVNDELQGS